MSLGLKESLVTLVKAQYAGAKAAGTLAFSTTELTLVNVQGTLFQLRYCPALAKKPTQHNVNRVASQDKKRFDPFEDPVDELLIAKVPFRNPSHILVLNKFPVIPHHFIIATIENKQQTQALEEDDLGLTYQCLKEWQETPSDIKKPNKLFAFFNSGKHSGASQPHRHLQLLPVPDMEQATEYEDRWSLLVDRISASKAVASSCPGTVLENPLPTPFAYYAARLPPNASASFLHDLYRRLYDRAVTKVNTYLAQSSQDLELESTELDALPISYNLGITTESMVLCPRRREGGIVCRSDGSEIDSVSLNGTLLGGTLLVKNEELWHLLARDAKKLDDVLGSVGLPPLSRHEDMSISL